MGVTGNVSRISQIHEVRARMVEIAEADRRFKGHCNGWQGYWNSCFP